MIKNVDEIDLCSIYIKMSTLGENNLKDIPKETSTFK